MNHIGYEIAYFFHGLDAPQSCAQSCRRRRRYKTGGRPFRTFLRNSVLRVRIGFLRLRSASSVRGTSNMVPESLLEGEGTGAVAVRDGVEQLIPRYGSALQEGACLRPGPPVRQTGAFPKGLSGLEIFQMQGLYGYIRVGIQRLIDVAQQGGHGGFVRDQRQGVIIFLQLWKSSAGISSRFISDRIWERSNSFQRKARRTGRHFYPADGKKNNYTRNNLQ